MARKSRNRKSAAKKLVIEESYVEMKAVKSPMKLPKRIFTYVLVLLVVGGLVYFGGKQIFIATVNGELVNRLSVIKELEKQGGKKVLETIILKTLINQEAKKRKLTVNQQEMDAELTKIETNVTSQGSTLDAILLQQGMTKNDLISEIKLQLLVTKMVEKNVSVTDKEIDEYLTSQKAQPAQSLDPTQTTPEMSRAQAQSTLRQQKLQGEIQTFVADLKAKAKINYFINY
jgi:hypothetical protein